MVYIQTFKFWIILILFKDIYSLIVIPFKTIKTNNTNNPFNIKNSIYSDILIGNSEQLLDVFFTSNMYTYYLEEESCIGDNFYNNNLSLINISSKDYIILDEDEKAIQINETLYLYKDLNLKQKIKIDNFPILVKINQINSEKLCLLLGLLYRVSGPLKIINFFEQLKKFKLIESYTWTMKYTNENEGLFIIGNEPDIYDPKNYDASKLKLTKPNIIENSYSWTIFFNKIYSGKNLISENNFCIISLGNNYIMGNKEYNKSIYSEFFEEYINKNICYFHHDSYSQNYYYCNKKIFTKKDISKFPPLSLINVELEEKFIFNGEELFYEEKEFYYFKIYFNDFSPVGWLIGKIFLKKYQFIFNYDKKIIGYYSNKTINNNELGDEESNSHLSPFKNNNSNNKIYIIIITVILLLIIITIIFILIKFYFNHLCCTKQRKKLVNELLDEDNTINGENVNIDKDMLVDMKF